jgi:hypothetical protein
LAPLGNKDLAAVPYYHDLRQALAQRGCAFCRLLAESAERYLDAVLWEMVNDVEFRSELNQARGFCREHGWLLARAGASLGVAILSRNVIQTLLEVAKSTPAEPTSLPVLEGLRRGLSANYASKSTANLAAGLAPQAPCPACGILQDREKQLADTLLAHLANPGALSDVYRSGDGLCLQHFRQCLQRSTSPARATCLVNAQMAVWKRLEGELGEFIRKSDHRFRHEEFGSESDSWRRALEAISGPAPRCPSDHGGLTQAHRSSSPR